MTTTIDSATSATHCSNCGSSTVEAYCASCGQRHAAERLTLRTWARDLADDLFSLEARLPRTVRALLLKPGFVAREWVDGRRARWTPPVRLYLLASVLMFAVPALLPDAHVVPLEDGADLSAVAAQMTRDAQEVEEVRRSGPVVLFLLLPVFALLTRTMFASARLYYPEHLVLAMHAHAVGFLTFALITALDALPGWWDNTDFVPFAALLVWLYLGARRFFGMGRWRTLAAGAAVFLIHVALLASMLAGVTLSRSETPAETRNAAHALYYEAFEDGLSEEERAARRRTAIVAYQRLEVHSLNTHARYHLAHLLMIDGATANARMYAEEALVRNPDDLLALGLAADAALALGDSAAAASYQAHFRAAWPEQHEETEYANHVEELEAFRRAAEGNPEQ